MYMVELCDKHTSIILVRNTVIPRPAVDWMEGDGDVK